VKDAETEPLIDPVEERVGKGDCPAGTDTVATGAETPWIP